MTTDVWGKCTIPSLLLVSFEPVHFLIFTEITRQTFFFKLEYDVMNLFFSLMKIWNWYWQKLTSAHVLH